MSLSDQASAAFRAFVYLVVLVLRATPHQPRGGPPEQGPIPLPHVTVIVDRETALALRKA